MLNLLIVRLRLLLLPFSLDELFGFLARFFKRLRGVHHCINYKLNSNFLPLFLAGSFARLNYYTAR